MQLYFRGIEVPALGSPRDLIFRAYLSHENRIQAKQQELLLLIALATPTLADSNSKRTWNTETTKIFNAYTSLLWGMEPKEVNEEDKKWAEYYAETIQQTKIVAKKGEKGQLIAELLQPKKSKKKTAS